jgi:Skp family chaperone for outer membrane proteins
MNKFAFGTAFAVLAAAIPAAAPAQRLPAAVVAVVDIARVSNECTACRAANTQLQQQVQQLQTRGQTLQQQIAPEGTAIQTALNALNGKQPDAALQARIQAYQTRENAANQELARSQQNIRSIQAHVSQQVSSRLMPIITQAMTNRGATVVIDKGGALASAPAIDITNDVLTALNQQLPSVSVTPLPQQPQQRQPQGR